MLFVILINVLLFIAFAFFVALNKTAAKEVDEFVFIGGSVVILIAGFAFAPIFLIYLILSKIYRFILK